MSPLINHTLNLTKAEQLVFPLEVDYLVHALVLGRSLHGRELEDVLVLYRRAYSQLSELERQLRAPDQLFMEEWVMIAFREGSLKLPPTDSQRLALLRFAALGLNAEDIATLVAAWKDQDAIAIGLNSYREASLAQLRSYLVFLEEFAPYLTEEVNHLARTLLLEDAHLRNEELVAEFITQYSPDFLDRFTAQGLTLLNYHTLWKVWFSVFSEHNLKEESLPDDYLKTPFREVIRNVPDRLWFLTAKKTGGVDFTFAIGQPGFYQLAAGNSARKYLTEIGMPRGAWRQLLSLPYETELLELAAPDLYLWALSLGANQELARQLPAFMPRRYQSAWEPVLQQLARLTTISWDLEEGQRLLGYIYHIVRDQPDFRVDVHRPELLMAASDAHYARIEQSMAAVARGRRAAVEADQEARARQAAVLAEQQANRRKEYEAWLRKTKWAPMNRVKPFRCSSRLRIQELTNGWELFLEGQAMGHCVGDYVNHCRLGRFSIWTLRVERDRKVRSLVTIRINVANRQIVEARARFNRDPLQEYKVLINEWARGNKIKPLSAWE
ncbi:PcfJ domain-containing protein [Neolewinella agarilytica]|uniref:PcfJ domain-containing protein n=1 Tax=Neolewinella agarilytica TaxID=478744 RepID=UPI002355B14D|nr:PcfJ domain-containing protein [Neolewinella agarilytica]